MTGSGESESAERGEGRSPSPDPGVPASNANNWEMPAIGDLDYVWGAVKRALLIAVIVIAISVFAPQVIDRLLEVLSQAERLRTIRVEWIVLMVLAEILSFASLWWLMKVLLPKVS